MAFICTLMGCRQRTGRRALLAWATVGFVIAFVGVNGLVEGAVCLITGAAIAKAVMYSRGKLAARKTNA